MDSNHCNSDLFDGEAGGLGWVSATLLVSFRSASSMHWFACRRGTPAKASPIQTTLPRRLFLKHTVAAVIVSLLWVRSGQS